MCRRRRGRSGGIGVVTVCAIEPLLLLQLLLSCVTTTSDGDEEDEEAGSLSIVIVLSKKCTVLLQSMKLWRRGRGVQAEDRFTGGGSIIMISIILIIYCRSR